MCVCVCVCVCVYAETVDPSPLDAMTLISHHLTMSRNFPQLAVRNDEELNKLLGHVTIAAGGVLPNVSMSMSVCVCVCVCLCMPVCACIRLAGIATHLPTQHTHTHLLPQIHAVLLPKRSSKSGGGGGGGSKKKKGAAGAEGDEED